ncbi:MAG: hypothetical protein ACRDAM_02680 [Casimicrobium sp.]
METQNSDAPRLKTFRELLGVPSVETFVVNCSDGTTRKFKFLELNNFENSEFIDIMRTDPNALLSEFAVRVLNRRRVGNDAAVTIQWVETEVLDLGEYIYAMVHPSIRLGFEKAAEVVKGKAPENSTGKRSSRSSRITTVSSPRKSAR